MWVLGRGLTGAEHGVRTLQWVLAVWDHGWHCYGGAGGERRQGTTAALELGQGSKKHGVGAGARGLC